MWLSDEFSDFLLWNDKWKGAFNSLNIRDSNVYEQMYECLKVLSVVLDEAPVGVVAVRRDDRVIIINHAAEQLFGYDRSQEPEIKWADIRRRKELCAHDESPLIDRIDPVYIALREKRRNVTKVLVKTKDVGYEEWVSVTALPVIGHGGDVLAAVAVIQDITNLIDMQEMIHYHAIHDHLTGLSNKVLITGTLSKAVARAKRNGTNGAFMIIDLDRFKKVNDVYGYVAGDDLLAKVGNRLRAEVRGTDSASRMEGNQFAVLLEDIAVDDDQIVADIAKRICDSISVRYQIHENEISITASIGVSLFPKDGMNEKLLIMKAEKAMRSVKQSGRNGWRFYEDEDPNPQIGGGI
jgi:diguanylate cyclase (GGDEF)-like protein/PAS domain S-box-containing protein